MANRSCYAAAVAAILILAVCLPALTASILEQTSTGTGFVIHSDGYILTNQHVVEGAHEITVTIGDTAYVATLVDTLVGSDLALLKVNAQGLPEVSLGDSEAVGIGDEIYALGCPAGICGTATSGRVANLDVSIQTEEAKLDGMLMIDVTIDHGSSGGPLLNTRGEVIGITTAGRQGSFGFAIPIHDAIQLLRSIPGFSSEQMNEATEERTFSDIREMVGPSTVFVFVRSAIPLTSLLPERALGSHLEIHTDYGYAGDLFGLATPGPFGPTRKPGIRQNLYDLLDDVANSHVKQAEGYLHRNIGSQRTLSASVMVFDLGGEQNAAAFSRSVQQFDEAGWFWEIILLDTKSLGEQPIYIALRWRGNSDSSEEDASIVLRGTASFALGSLAFVVWLSESETATLGCGDYWSRSCDRMGDAFRCTGEDVNLATATSKSCTADFHLSVNEFVETLNELLDTAVEAIRAN